MADEATRLFEGQCPVPTGNTLLDACPLFNILGTIIRKTNLATAIICGTFQFGKIEAMDGWPIQARFWLEWGLFAMDRVARR